MTKKIISRILAIMVVSSTLLPNAPSQNIYANDEIFLEDKIYSNATLNDEFADNRVLVVMSHQASLQFKQYNAENFDENICKSVSNLSAATETKLKTANIQSTTQSVDTRHVNQKLAEYNQVLCLELKNAGKENVLKAIKELQKRDDVIYAGPDYIMDLCSTSPNDTSYYRQWAADKIQLPQAWDVTTGSSLVTVGVIDTGIQGTHVDLADNINISLSRDFVMDSDEPIATDPHGHGTHVAGIIGACGNNEEGISGVCWDVQLVSLRAFYTNGKGYFTDIIQAIDYAEEQGIQILNLSGGGYSDENTPLLQSIQNYSGLLICAAGNDNKNTHSELFYPSCYSLYNLISVGASDENDERWHSNTGGSNYGQVTVDLFAPGDDIYSTYPYSAYMRHSGTSMATPYVTGVAALLLSKYPDLTPCEIKDTIMSTVDDCGTTFDSLCVSEGRLNAYKALTNVVRHSAIYTSINSQKHRRICVAHNTFRTSPHSLHYFNEGIGYGHSVFCSNCDYEKTEPHTWISVGNKIRCSGCGAITTNAPVTPFSLPPEIRARIEQMAFIGDFAMDIGDGTVLCRVGDQYYLVAGQTEATALSYLQHELSVILPDHEAA